MGELVVCKYKVYDFAVGKIYEIKYSNENWVAVAPIGYDRLEHEKKGLKHGHIWLTTVEGTFELYFHDYFISLKDLRKRKLKEIQKYD